MAVKRGREPVSATICEFHWYCCEHETDSVREGSGVREFSRLHCKTGHSIRSLRRAEGLTSREMLAVRETLAAAMLQSAKRSPVRETLASFVGLLGFGSLAGALRGGFFDGEWLPVICAGACDADAVCLLCFDALTPLQPEESYFRAELAVR
jgi:hypothetical protein